MTCVYRIALTAGRLGLFFHRLDIPILPKRIELSDSGL